MTSEGGRQVAAKGLFTAGEEEKEEEGELENGFDGAVVVVVVVVVVLEFVEKGLSEVEVEDGAVPNRDSPRFVGILDVGVSPLNPSLPYSFRLALDATSVILLLRSALTLPSLRLHVLRRHAKTYKRLSCPGKNSGRSPFNCRSKTIRSLHDLHFAKVADGG